MSADFGEIRFSDFLVSELDPATLSQKVATERGKI